VSRDYLTVKIWDVQMESRPVKTIVLHDYLRPMLYDLYTNDTIFDKFEVCCSPDGRSIATGSYSNQLKISHQDQRGLKSIDLPRPSPENGATGPTATMSVGGDGSGAEVSRSLERMRMGHGAKSQAHDQDEVRLDEKVLHCAWHPTNNTVAVAGKAGLCLYKV
jgi:serine/threonine-protein phosphatase 2A regulatory subunit B